MTVYEADNYHQFVEFVLYGNSSFKRHGLVKELAHKLQCHPTFVSQIAHQKSHFNLDQALGFCAHFHLSSDETDFFLNLHNRDRAGLTTTRDFFQHIIDKKLSARRSLHVRHKIARGLNEQQEALYFKSWWTPIVHAALLIPGLNNALSIAQSLKVDLKIVQEALELLEVIEVAHNDSGQWSALREFLYIDPDSPLNDSFQAGWRLKTGQLFLDRKKTSEHTHTSAIVSISNAAAEEIREILLKDLDKIRRQVEASKSERLFVFCVDFYPLS